LTSVPDHAWQRARCRWLCWRHHPWTIEVRRHRIFLRVVGPLVKAGLRPRLAMRRVQHWRILHKVSHNLAARHQFVLLPIPVPNAKTVLEVTIHPRLAHYILVKWVISRGYEFRDETGCWVNKNKKHKTKTKNNMACPYRAQAKSKRPPSSKRSVPQRVSRPPVSSPNPAGRSR
jgi:hypothetical protein